MDNDSVNHFAFVGSDPGETLDAWKGSGMLELGYKCQPCVATIYSRCPSSSGLVPKTTTARTVQLTY